MNNLLSLKGKSLGLSLIHCTMNVLIKHMNGVIIVQKIKEECIVTSYSAIMMKMALSHTINILFLLSILIKFSNANNRRMY